LTLRKYDMSGFKGTITLSAKAGDSLTVQVADHVPAGNDLKRLAIRNQHTDLPGTRVAFTNTGAVTITAPAKDTVYDAFFFPQIDTTIYFRGLRFFGGGAPINYGCLDPSESKLTARPTVAGVYTVGMTPPLASVELRGGAEPIVSAAVKRLNDAWRVFPDFAVHRIDLDLNARNAPFMMGWALPTISTVSPRFAHRTSCSSTQSRQAATTSLREWLQRPFTDSSSEWREDPA